MNSSITNRSLCLFLNCIRMVSITCILLQLMFLMLFFRDMLTHVVQIRLFPLFHCVHRSSQMYWYILLWIDLSGCCFFSFIWHFPIFFCYYKQCISEPSCSLVCGYKNFSRVLFLKAWLETHWWIIKSFQWLCDQHSFFLFPIPKEKRNY